jgi:hypothetical protein
MNISSKLVGAGLAFLGAMSVSAMNDSVLAGSISQPGEIVGYTWAPLPQGLYFATTESYGNWRGLSNNAEGFVSIPVLVWSTPWTLLGARVESYVAVPSASVTAPHTGNVVTAAGAVVPTGTHVSGIYNPFAAVGLAWDLGNGWGISEFVGGYAPTNNSLGQDFFTFNERLGVTWAQGPWSLTGHVIYGITGNNASSSVGVAYGAKTSPNYVNLDLTGTYTIGKWSFGAVAFGSWDVSHTSYLGAVGTGGTYAKQSQFAVGPFVGYNFGPVILQAWVTRDVATQNYYNALPAGGFVKDYETRGWLRVIVPLWNPPAPAPVVAKY